MTTQRTSLHVVINVPAKSYQKKVPPPTLPKPKATKYGAEESSELSFPAPPPEAYEQQNQDDMSFPAPPAAAPATDQGAEDELAKLTDLLMKNLENTDDPDFFGSVTPYLFTLHMLNTVFRSYCIHHNITLRCLAWY